MIVQTLVKIAVDLCHIVHFTINTFLLNRVCYYKRETIDCYNKPYLRINIGIRAFFTFQIDRINHNVSRGVPWPLLGATPAA